jgi:hypothetical protein
VKLLRKWLRGNLVIIPAFICGAAARGILDGLDAPLWFIVVIYAGMFLVVLGFNRPKPPKPIPKPVRTVVDTPIFSSPYAPRGQAIVMNPDDIQKIIQRWPAPPAPDLFRTVDSFTRTPNAKHSEGCPARWSVLGMCTCRHRPNCEFRQSKANPVCTCPVFFNEKAGS